MKQILCVIALLVLTSCSRGEGIYIGKPVDVGWEGYLSKSCEVHFKTSEQASAISKASTTSAKICNHLQNNLGQTFRVSWRHCFPCMQLGSDYEITDIIGLAGHE